LTAFWDTYTQRSKYDEDTEDIIQFKALHYQNIGAEQMQTMSNGINRSECTIKQYPRDTTEVRQDTWKIHANYCKSLKIQLSTFQLSLMMQQNERALYGDHLQQLW
jgi:hypothetical protein